MFANTANRAVLALGLFCSGVLLAFGAEAEKQAKPLNLFGNPSFEDGTELWTLGLGETTDATLTVDGAEAADGKRSALLKVNTVESFGVQFGQQIGAPVQGKTYTFAVLAKSMKEPVTLALEIERHADPYDRAAKLQGTTVTKDGWRELHVTFKVEKAFPEGWFAYVSCLQPNAEFRLDMFRLYEGEYVASNLATEPATTAESAAPAETAPAPEKPKETAAMPAVDGSVKLFDTGRVSPAPLSGNAVEAKAGWKIVPEDATDYAFAGDAVMLNNRLAVVFRRGGPGAEVYGLGQQPCTLRAVLKPVGETADMRLRSLMIVDNSAAEATISATFQSSGGKALSVRYSLGAGQLYVKTESAEGGAKALMVEAPSRFLIMPDFFADDIVVDAAQIPVATAELPSENFLVHLLPDRNVIVMTVSESREQDARVALSGDGPQRLITGSEIYYGKSGKVWVALLEGPGIWHQRDISRSDANKIIPLDWTAPYPCLWRVDWHGTDKLTSSWEMIMELQGGRFQKPAMWGDNSVMLPNSRQIWATVLGSYSYPCWLDKAARGYLQPMPKAVHFEGPAVIYPLNRVKATPLDQFSVVDVVRATLGVGPCQYILDVEGQGMTRKGIATCANRDELQAIYKSNQQKQSKAKIETALTNVVIFVKHIRGRIEEYSAFGHEMLQYLAEQRKAHPELSGFLTEMENITKEIDAGIERRKDKIQTPQYVMDLTDEFRRNVMDMEGPDAFKECKRITEAIVVVGGNQDELVGECRVHVKVLRQRAAMAMALDPAAAEVAKEIRDRTQKILRNALSYEHPRH